MCSRGDAFPPVSILNALQINPAAQLTYLVPLHSDFDRSGSK